MRERELVELDVIGKNEYRYATGARLVKNEPGPMVIDPAATASEKLRIGQARDVDLERKPASEPLRERVGIRRRKLRRIRLCSVLEMIMDECLCHACMRAEEKCRCGQRDTEKDCGGNRGHPPPATLTLFDAAVEDLCFEPRRSALDQLSAMTLVEKGLCGDEIAARCALFRVRFPRRIIGRIENRGTKIRAVHCRSSCEPLCEERIARSFARPRAARDATVPSEMPRASAISR